MACYITIEKLNKTIKGNIILKDISITVPKQSICGFVGINGSGKTMLFRAICGLIKPDSGTISIDGKKMGHDISFPPSLGVVIEKVGLWPQLTGIENLKVLANVKKIISDNDIKDAIRRVGLDPNDKRTNKKYSLGMKQRLLIAQAIMEHPDLIILDEPTDALDEDGVTLIREIILAERARGATVLISSHNSEDIRILCDKQYRLKNGEISEEILNRDDNI